MTKQQIINALREMAAESFENAEHYIYKHLMARKKRMRKMYSNFAGESYLLDYKLRALADYIENPDRRNDLGLDNPFCRELVRYNPASNIPDLTKYPKAS